MEISQVIVDRVKGTPLAKDREFMNMMPERRMQQPQDLQ
jgi:hypothetical protein